MSSSTDRSYKPRWPKSIGVGRFLFAVFNYWIGFSCRDIKIARVVDAGFFKFWLWRK